MYDPETNEWKDMKEMNECRREAARAVVNGKIFCSGDGRCNSVEYYDPSSDVWTLISTMPQNIWEHSAVGMNGHFIVMERGIVWALDTTDKNAVWIEKSSMAIRRRRFSIAKIDDKVFVCGGNYGLEESTDSVEIFDGEVWRDGPSMPTRRVGAPAVVISMEFARSLK